MEAVVTIRLDIAKSVFQVHGVDADGAVIVAGGLRARLARVARIGQAGDIGQPDVIAGLRRLFTTQRGGFVRALPGLNLLDGIGNSTQS